jgi:ribonuclease R/exosome complex exonuclease DIS3/RRP44
MEDSKEDLFIHSKNLGTALDSDKVEVNVIKDASGKGRDTQGVVLEIKERNKTEFSGVIDINEEKGFAFVRTSGHKMPVDFYVPLAQINGAKDGEVVVVKLQKWSSKDKSPLGIVTKVHGKPGSQETEMGEIMAKHNIDYSFPEEVMKEAEAIPVEIPEKEILKRRDMRDILTFTIDGSDAKDLDDALSFSKLVNGNYEVGVHIADIGYYVKKGGKIDVEALNRGTSVYLVSKCMPMLPEKLSNNLASLNPSTDKLTVSVIFEITPGGEIKKHKFKKTVINSNYRFTYDEVQDIIEKKYLKTWEIANDEPTIADLIDAIVKLDVVAKKIRAKRFKNEAISFNSREPQFILDENNIPIDICFNELKDANQLIEEFALLTNRYVGTFLYKNKIPAAFRVHDSPNEDKIKELSSFVKQFGYELNTNGNIQSVKKSLNKLLNEIKGTSEENMISTLAVRCMSKAVCNTTNIGHYGLGDNFMPPNAYTWFTSGIRRYADIVNQRQLFDFLEGRK